MGQRQVRRMSRRGNILFLAHRVPFPPDKGDKIRTHHQLRRLASSHHVYCACFVDRPEDRLHAVALHEWCREVCAIDWSRSRAMWRAAAAILCGGTLTTAAYDCPAMRRQIDAWNATIEFDAVVAFSACMAPYAEQARARRRVLDLCDADSRKWLDYAERGHGLRSRIYGIEGRRLEAYERKCVARFDSTIVITDRERALLDPGERCDRLHVIPNGVDLPAIDVPSAAGCDPVITFVGAMDYPPNVSGILWFARHVWPGVQKAVPGARLMIVGRNPTREVRGLARLPGVCVTGEVPSVWPYLLQSRVAIAPLHIARGLANKALEAMASSRPVVATTGVAQSLGAEPDRHLLTADGATAFARQVIRLCRSDPLCNRLAEAGYRHVAMNYCWAEAMDRYAAVVVGRKGLGPTVTRMRSKQIVRYTSEEIENRTKCLLPSDRGVRQEMPKPTHDFRYRYSPT